MESPYAKALKKFERLVGKKPGKKYDEDKLRFDLIPPITFKALASILTMGASKYGPNNWQNLEDFEARYTGALMRHLNAWRSGEKKDPESGHPHLWHALCNVVFLIWREDNGVKGNATCGMCEGKGYAIIIDLPRFRPGDALQTYPCPNGCSVNRADKVCKDCLDKGVDGKMCPECY